MHWVSKLQGSISPWTLEAKCVALSRAMRELVPMRRLVREIVPKVDPKALEDPTSLKSTVFEDDNGAIATVEALAMTARAKHIAVKCHCTRSHIGLDKKGHGVLFEKVESEFQLANILTKGSVEEDFQ